MSFPAKVKRTGQLFQAHSGADFRDAHEILPGNPYSGDLYHTHQISESTEMIEFVFTGLEWATFGADELTEFTFAFGDLNPSCGL
jgi:hypothetical protein